MTCTALEAAGVEFIAENGGGLGVRLRNPNYGYQIRKHSYYESGTSNQF